MKKGAIEGVGRGATAWLTLENVSPAAKLDYSGRASSQRRKTLLSFCHIWLLYSDENLENTLKYNIALFDYVFK